jgi:hypothetical protein
VLLLFVIIVVVVSRQQQENKNNNKGNNNNNSKVYANVERTVGHLKGVAGVEAVLLLLAVVIVSRVRCCYSSSSSSSRDNNNNTVRTRMEQRRTQRTASCGSASSGSPRSIFWKLFYRRLRYIEYSCRMFSRNLFCLVCLAYIFNVPGYLASTISRIAKSVSRTGTGLGFRLTVAFYVG